MHAPKPKWSDCPLLWVTPFNLVTKTTTKNKKSHRSTPKRETQKNIVPFFVVTDAEVLFPQKELHIRISIRGTGSYV